MYSNILIYSRSLRPKQWAKNLLLFFAPFAAGIHSLPDLLNLGLGFIAFSIASSIGYLFNDLNDLDIDRKHPKKSLRPLASGSISPKNVIWLSVILLLILTGLLSLLLWTFAFVVVLYLINTYLYTAILKKIPVVEMFSVAFGFILRLIAGALLLELKISSWFLIVGGFGAVFVVTAKRLAEFRQAKHQTMRKVVEEYTDEFLYSSLSISASVCLTGYCIWALTQEQNAFWYQLSVAPFVMSVFRYRWMSERSIVEAPEDAILGDRTLLLLSICLVSFLTIAVY